LGAQLSGLAPGRHRQKIHEGLRQVEQAVPANIIENRVEALRQIKGRVAASILIDIA
jgi:hypothetical protein